MSMHAERSGSWLCPDDQARARVLENSRRVRRARTVASFSIGLAVLYAAPTYGWPVLAIFAISLLNTQTVDVRMRRVARPEYQAAATMLLSQVLCALVAAITGGPRSPLLSLMVVPTAFVATRFRSRVCFAATGIAIALLLAATFVTAPQATIDHPGGLLTALVLLVGVGAATQALFAAELQHRRTALLDPLTGLLNRQGLEGHFEELAEQARLMAAPISLLMCDLDHFKLINDLHGHAMGDAVLRDVAFALRRQLRAFELIYRLGGEEFLVVLPGANPDRAAELAERLCQAIRQCHPQNLDITVSIGVATQCGGDLEFAPLFEAADRALYQAKAKGRDRVMAAPEVMSSDPRMVGELAAL
jgi:diguanylate cyclase (GGDEF)-like protein